MLSIVILCFQLTGCVHTEEDFVRATQVEPERCDEGIVYFEQEIYPALLANCTNSGCHDDQSRAKSISMTSYASLMESNIIDLNTPSNSLLYQVLSDSNRNAAENALTDLQMPPDPYPQLPKRIQEKILTWISQGANNSSCASVCDTAAVSYTNTIKPLIAKGCLSCHLPPEPAAGLDFTQFQVIKDMTLHGGFINNPRVTRCDSIQFELWLERGTPHD